jgi:hypothetical protein
MSNIVTHLGQNLPWIGFKNGHNQYTITFTSGGSAFDISTYTFTVNIRKYGASTNALQLTQASGITNGGATGILTIALTQTQASTTLPASDYFYEITYVKDSKTYALLQGGLTLSSESNPASTTTSVDVSVNLAGSAINAEVTLAGAGGGSSAADITFAPIGNIASANVQAAIEELDSEKARASDLSTHTSNTSNPHSVTKSQVGLSSVDNTSDASKPVSTAQQTALDAKVPTTRTIAGVDLVDNITANELSDALKARRILYKNNVSSSVTGTSTETILHSVLVPGGTLQANDVLRIVSLCTKSGTAGTWTHRVRAHTSLAASGNVIVLSATTVATQTYSKQLRELVLKNSISSQEVLTTGNEGFSSTPLTSLSIDFSIDQYLMVTAALGSTADTVTSNSFYLEIIRGS